METFMTSKKSIQLCSISIQRSFKKKSQEKNACPFVFFVDDSFANASKNVSFLLGNTILFNQQAGTDKKSQKYFFVLIRIQSIQNLNHKTKSWFKNKMEKIAQKNTTKLQVAGILKNYYNNNGKNGYVDERGFESANE